MNTNLSTFFKSSLLATGLTIAASTLQAAHAASLTVNATQFTGDIATAIITLEDIGNDIRFTVDASNSPTGGDLRALFFNVADESILSDLKVSGLPGPDEVTTFKFGPANTIDDLGNGANVTGGGQVYKFDAGIEIGTQGASKDFYSTAIFTLSSITGKDLDLSLFANQLFGVRITSTTGPEGSTKLVGTSGGVGNVSTSVPEPGTNAALGLFGIGAIAFLKKNKKSILQVSK